MSAVPTWLEWLALTDPERREIQSRWNAYGGEGHELVSAVAADFKAKYGDLPGVVVNGPGVYHGGDWVIGVTHPFVFDHRTVPDHHLGIQIRRSHSEPLPPEFRGGIRQHEYVWAPAHYEQFVDRAADEIRAMLGRPDMGREEMLSALTGIPFREFEALYQDWKKEK